MIMDKKWGVCLQLLGCWDVVQNVRQFIGDLSRPPKHYSINLTKKNFDLQILGKLIRPKSLSAKDLLSEPELTNVAMLDHHHNSGNNFINLNLKTPKVQLHYFSLLT